MITRRIMASVLLLRSAYMLAVRIAIRRRIRRRLGLRPQLARRQGAGRGCLRLVRRRTLVLRRRLLLLDALRRGHKPGS